MTKIWLRCAFAWGIVVMTYVVVTPGGQYWQAAIAGLLIGLGAGGWSDR